MAHKTGLEDYYVIKNQKKLHFGYTTGSCAAGAAKGATEMLLGGQKQNETDLMTPKGFFSIWNCMTSVWKRYSDLRST